MLAVSGGVIDNPDSANRFIAVEGRAQVLGPQAKVVRLTLRVVKKGSAAAANTTYHGTEGCMTCGTASRA